MTIRVTSHAVIGNNEGVAATVLASSKDQLAGKPVMELVMRLRLPPGSTVDDVYDRALSYLDIE